jgi:hypothetical protein
MSDPLTLGASGISAAVKRELAVDWAAVRKLTGATHQGGVIGAAIVTYTAPAGFLNLPLMLAYSVLDRFLGELIYPGKRRPLEVLMDESRSRLIWKDFGLVEKGKEARNGVAHRADLVADAACLRYIAAVEAELIGWCVIDS